MSLSDLKDVAPAPVRRVLGKTRAVWRRALIWWNVSRELAGVNTHDRAVLRRALLSAPVDIFRGLDRWRDPVVSEDCRIRARGIGVFSVRADSDDLYHALPSREEKVLATIRSTLRPGDVFVDAGANIGVYSVLASQLVGQQGNVISFEMMPETARILRGHLLQNECSNASVIEGALSDEPGRIVTAYTDGKKHGQSSIICSKGDIEICVQTTTLKNELSEITRVRLMKMDLEGAELSALKGLGADISKIEYIVFEELGHNETATYLAEAGFLISELSARDKLASRESGSL